MAKTTGIILAIGGISIANQVIFNDQEMDWKVPIATGIAAMTFSGIEKINPQIGVGLAYVALVAILFTRIDPKVPSPTESALDWWNKPAGPGPKKSSAQKVVSV